MEYKGGNRAASNELEMNQVTPAKSASVCISHLFERSHTSSSQATKGLNIMRGLSTTLAVLTALTSVSAHATFQEASVNGVDQAKKCTRLPVCIAFLRTKYSEANVFCQLSNSPVTSVTSNDIRCNAGTKPANETCEATGAYSSCKEDMVSIY